MADKNGHYGIGETSQASYDDGTSQASYGDGTSQASYGDGTSQASYGDGTSQASYGDGTSQASYGDGTSQASYGDGTSRSSTFAKHNPRSTVQGARSKSSGARCGIEPNQTVNENDAFLRRRENLPPRQPVITTEQAELQETTRQADRRLRRNGKLANPDQQIPSLFTYWSEYFTSSDFHRRLHNGTYSPFSIVFATLLSFTIFIIYLFYLPDSEPETSEVHHRK